MEGDDVPNVRCLRRVGGGIDVDDLPGYKRRLHRPRNHAIHRDRATIQLGPNGHHGERDCQQEPQVAGRGRAPTAQGSLAARPADLSVSRGVPRPGHTVAIVRPSRIPNQIARDSTVGRAASGDSAIVTGGG